MGSSSSKLGGGHGPALPAETKSDCLKMTIGQHKPVGGRVWGLQELLSAVGVCCQAWLRAMSTGHEDHVFSNLLPPMTMSCWAVSESTETCKQSVWVPQISTTNAEIIALFIPPTIQCIQEIPLRVQNRGTVQMVGTCQVDRKQNFMQ
jgi:hypothetical protein